VVASTAPHIINISTLLFHGASSVAYYFADIPERCLNADGGHEINYTNGRVRWDEAGKDDLRVLANKTRAQRESPQFRSSRNRGGRCQRAAHPTHFCDTLAGGMSGNTEPRELPEKPGDTRLARVWVIPKLAAILGVKRENS
jgi:hypothetical protein